jgi:hypothetical protein
MQKQVAAPLMAQPKPTAVWAYVGLITGVLACLTAAPLPFIDYGYIAGATAGVGLAGPFLLGLLLAIAYAVVIGLLVIGADVFRG